MGESFTIQISSKLVKQLADEGENKKKTRKSKTRLPRDSQKVKPKVQQKQISDDTETPRGTAALDWPVQPPLFLPVSPPHFSNAELNAIRSAVQESEKVLERLQKQEQVMVQEVTQRAKDLRDKEFKLPQQKPPPCLEEKDACFECYQEHVKAPLKCANLVKNYADCVRNSRQQVSWAAK